MAIIKHLYYVVFNLFYRHIFDPFNLLSTANLLLCPHPL